MANFPRSIAVVLLFACVVAALGCSSRRVYQATANVGNLPDAVNINTASADELERIPHIGRKTAESIVQFRELNGPFRRPEDLMQIRGVSESRFAEIRQYIKTE